VTTYSIGQGELTPPIGGATISWSRASALRLTDRTATPVVATRVLRAPLPPTDFCVGDPSGEARGLVDDGFTTHYEYALQALERGWLTTGGGVRPPADAVRFYALRLREVGMIKFAPTRSLLRPRIGGSLVSSNATSRANY
jgi:hypothetical protein